MTGGRRERKKLETYRSLALAARELAVERGLDGFTAEDVAEAADVSLRTFFNYFACKEEAIVGVEPTVLALLGDQLTARPASEAPLEALRAVIAPDADSLASAAYRWTLRTELVARYPSLLPRHLAGLAQVESALVSALAQRLGVDATEDPYPTVVVAAVVGALHATVSWWESTGRTADLAGAVDALFATLAAGLPAPAARR